MPWEAIAGDIPVSIRIPRPAALSNFATGLLLELHLPDLTLPALMRQQGSKLAEFLRTLHLTLCNAAGLPNARQLKVVSIHGRYRRANYGRVSPLRGGANASGEHLNEEVVVIFRVVDVQGGVAAETVLQMLRNQLATPGSALQQSKLGPVLRNATLSLSTSLGLQAATPESERDRVSQVSAMALPIGISAAFIGVLIWLAAW